MSLAERNESAVRAWPRAMPIDTMAGPMAAAAIVPAAVMMAGLVTAWGVGLGLASALVAIRRQGAPGAANDPARSQVETLPRLAVVAGPAMAAPKDGGLKAPAAAKPPKPARSVAAAPKPRSAAAAPAPARPAPARRKATPAVTVAPATLESTTTAKGISLPRLSIQDAKPDDPAEA
jgi:hypothetical protein